MFRKILLLGALSIPLGCSNVTGPNDSRNPLPSEGVVAGVSLEIDASDFERPDTLEIALVNNGSDVVGYNLCGSWREQERDDGWVKIESLRICTAELRLLAPGERATWREPVDDGWGDGRYRMATNVWPGAASSSVTIRSPTFEVGP